MLKYAFAEFAQQGYLGGSVNTICTAGKISKGLLYHYYTDKDALYLSCVQQCFQELTAALSAALDAKTVTPDQYFDVRLVLKTRKKIGQSSSMSTRPSLTVLHGKKCKLSKLAPAVKSPLSRRSRAYSPGV